MRTYELIVTEFSTYSFDERILYLRSLTTPELNLFKENITTKENYSFPSIVSMIDANTIGDITFEYASSGEYRIISDGLFTQDKTFFMSQTTQDNTPQAIITTMTYQDSSTIYLRTLMTRIGYQDGFLLNTPIEIRVYSKSH
jgi:hypothetical protein